MVNLIPVPAIHTAQVAGSEPARSPRPATKLTRDVDLPARRPDVAFNSLPAGVLRVWDWRLSCFASATSTGPRPRAGRPITGTFHLAGVRDDDRRPGRGLRLQASSPLSVQPGRCPEGLAAPAFEAVSGGGSGS
jgi:hypothetical protein